MITSPINRGWIEVICGGMFSGKTEELIRRLKRAIIAGQRVAIFKSQTDDRYSRIEIVTHDGQKLESKPVKKPNDILSVSSGSLEAEVVAIDEVQFFGEEIISICKSLANMGKRVIVAGLDMDFRGEPFGPTPQLMAIAEKVIKVHAICMKCGNPASFSQLIIEETSGGNILVGGKESYVARCRRCFYSPEN